LHPLWEKSFIFTTYLIGYLSSIKKSPFLATKNGVHPIKEIFGRPNKVFLGFPHPIISQRECKILAITFKKALGGFNPIETFRVGWGPRKNGLANVEGLLFNTTQG